MMVGGVWRKGHGWKSALMILPAVAGIVLMLAPSSQAGIVVGRNVGKFHLGYSKSKVRRTYGKPTSAHTYRHLGETVWDYIPLLTGVTFKRGRLKGITTYSKRQRTNRGIGPGSSYAATKATYPKAKCREGTFGPEARTCTLYRKWRGHRVVTDFVFYKRSLPMREVDIEAQPTMAGHRR